MFARRIEFFNRMSDSMKNLQKNHKRVKNITEKWKKIRKKNSKLTLSEQIKIAVCEGIKNIDLIEHLIKTNQLDRLPREKEDKKRAFNGKKNYSERKKENPKGNLHGKY